MDHGSIITRVFPSAFIHHMWYLHSSLVTINESMTVLFIGTSFGCIIIMVAIYTNATNWLLSSTNLLELDTVVTLAGCSITTTCVLSLVIMHKSACCARYQWACVSVLHTGRISEWIQRCTWSTSCLLQWSSFHVTLWCLPCASSYISLSMFACWPDWINIYGHTSPCWLACFDYQPVMALRVDWYRLLTYLIIVDHQQQPNGNMISIAVASLS